ncbi:AmmeMemoRadiSam system protein A, partial [Elusimicrobiota bacterium]
VGVEPLFQGVVRNAVNASAYDRRFSPVQPAELRHIQVEVSVLSPLKKVSSYEEIIPGWHGIVLKKASQQAVFLPQVAMEFGWGLEQTLSQLSKKAGLERDGWKDGAQFEIFEAQIIPE